MDDSMLVAQPPVAAVTSKKLRSGTRSCSECRRRKIRCTFAPNKLECTPCSVRGSRCVDQRQKPYRTTRPTFETQDGHAFTPGVAPSQPTTKHAAEEPADKDVLTDDQRNRPPIVSVITDINELWSASSETHEPPLIRRPAPGYSATALALEHQSMAQSGERKAKSVCETLRSALPSFDTLLSTLTEHGSWWSSFRFKTHPIVGQLVEGLPEFATRIYTSNNPTQLGLLAAAYARSLSRNHHLFSLVENLVISDSVYLCTIECLECLILLARSLTEIGHPRRAWLLWRRGMASAQLMGLYREGVKNPLANSIWWAIFHGDRFTSLLLGVPHGFNDSYYGLNPGYSEPTEAQFILRISILAGKIIERNVASGSPSFAQTMCLDERLDESAALLPQSWWDIPDELSYPGSDNDLRERLLQQFYFFFIKSHLHLPFMARSRTSPNSVISKIACIASSRHLLKRFLLLRSTAKGPCLYDCKTTAFLAFMAAVIVALGLDNLSNMPTSTASGDDMYLLQTVQGIFHGVETREGCMISSQCGKVLETLIGSRRDDSQAPERQQDRNEIKIPYFGVVLRRRAHQNLNVNETLTLQADDSPLVSNLVAGADFQGFEYSASFMTDLMITEPGLPGVGVGLDDADDPLWYQERMMDLDEDWNFFAA